MSVAEPARADHFAVEAHTHRKTALVALRGELDLVTVSKVAEVFNGLQPQSSGVRHVVLELTGVEEQLVLVDDPDDLAPRPWTA